MGTLTATKATVEFEPESETYAVTLKQATGGTATATPVSATAGTTISHGIASLDAGYSFVRWGVSPSVIWMAGSATDASSAFTMPDSTM